MEIEDMMKKILSFGVILLSLGTIIALFGGQQENGNSNDLSSTATPIVSRNNSSASRVSNAVTVNELVLESDLVVMARVAESPVTRVVRIEVPVLDEVGNIVDSAVVEVLFSDTVFKVLENYVGKPTSMITVMQTGGVNPTKPSSIEEVMDDPLYEIGDEYILFLVDISGDHVHAPERELYRIVNPFGRYRIDGETVFTYGQNPNSVLSTTSDITELETQIEQIAQELNK